jgi:hypothetical protein
MPAYVISDVEFLDPVQVAEYRALAAASIAKQYCAMHKTVGVPPAISSRCEAKRGARQPFGDEAQDRSLDLMLKRTFARGILPLPAA